MGSAIEKAVDALSRGEMVVVADGVDRENEGDIFLAAEHATPEAIAFFLSHTSGFICVATTGEICDHLGLPLMVATNREAHRTAFTVTVDASRGISTGISATDRASTINILGDETSTESDLVRPGHVHVLRARNGGIVERPGHTEAAVHLATLAGIRPSIVICEIVTDDKVGMLKGAANAKFAESHGLAYVTIAELLAESTDLPDTRSGDNTATAREVTVPVT